MHIIVLLAIVLIGTCVAMVPTILVPGIGGSVLYASNSKLARQRVWLSYRNQDKYALEYMDSWFSNGTTYSINGYTIDTNSTGWIDGNLDQIDTLDPDLWFGGSKTYYMHYIIDKFKKNGYQPGVSLFGFPYDWRQHVCHPSIINEFWKTVDVAMFRSNSSSVNIISHSMGGLLVQCAFQKHRSNWDKINKWITIATPFRGTGGYSIKAYMNGYDMGIGHTWIGGFTETVSSKIMLHFASVPNLLPLVANPSNMSQPSLSFTLDQHDKSVNITLMGSELLMGIESMTNLTSEFVMSGQTWRKNQTIVPKFQTFAIYSSSWVTPHNITVKKAINNLQQLRTISDNDIVYGNVPGDGTVPMGSATSPFFSGTTLIHYKGWGDHVDMLKDEKLIEQLLKLI